MAKKSKDTFVLPNIKYEDLGRVDGEPVAIYSVPMKRVDTRVSPRPGIRWITEKYAADTLKKKISAINEIPAAQRNDRQRRERAVFQRGLQALQHAQL